MLRDVRCGHENCWQRIAMVSINIALEKPLTLQEVSKLVPFSYSTLQRWSKKGYRGITLERLPFPGKVLTSLEAIQRFCERIDNLETQGAPAVPADSANVDRLLREQFGI